MRRPRPSAMDALLPQTYGVLRQTYWSLASDLLFAFADQATQQPADVVLLGGLRLDPIADLLLLLAHMGDQGLDALGQARHRRRALALILRIDGDGLACGFLHDGRRVGLHMAGQKILKLSVEKIRPLPRLQIQKTENQRTGEAEQRGGEPQAHSRDGSREPVLEVIEHRRRA